MLNVIYGKVQNELENQNIEAEILAICFEQGVSYPALSVIVKPSLRQMVLGDKLELLDGKSFYSFTYNGIVISLFTMQDLFRCIKTGETLLSSIIDDFSDDNNKCIFYYKGKPVINNKVDEDIVYTTLDFLKILKRDNKLNKEVLDYLLEVEYNLREISLPYFFKLISTPYSEK